MITHQLRAIRSVDMAVYDLEFRDRDDKEVVVRCVVSVRDGITSFDPNPDLFMPGLVSVREVSAAIAAFHEALRAGYTGS